MSPILIGKRPLSLILSEAFQKSNYVAVRNARRVYPAFRENAWRYFSGRGSYPYRCQLRTPLGVVAPTLHSAHDMFTVNEVFCREDYPAQAGQDVVVDIGSNIGLSALYFLTRSASARSYLYEPVPANVTRLRQNLAGYEERYELEVAAVAAEPASGVDFGIEPTGRYGGVGLVTGSSISVRCLGINEVLASVLEREPAIDILKLDTEGLELATVTAIQPQLLDRIDAIYFETPRPQRVHSDRFEQEFSNQTCRLTRRRF